MTAVEPAALPAVARALLLLFTEQGLLSSLEVFAYGDDPLPLPAPDRSC